jgi:putative phosphoribosyl transferase
VNADVFSPNALQVAVHAGDAELQGELTAPDQAVGIVAFAHGSGSGRHSPRNRRVAKTFNEAGIATLLLDLLTAREEGRDRVTAEYRFDIDLLARRLVSTVDWIRRNPATVRLPLGLFGASTGAAAALVAAAVRSEEIAAVVSRGGRPDLAGPALPAVKAPTLLIVGGADEQVLDLNRQALELMQTEKRLVVIPGATHLFEEPGALEEVARLATEWFLEHFLEERGDV